MSGYTLLHALCDAPKSSHAESIVHALFSEEYRLPCYTIGGIESMVDRNGNSPGMGFNFVKYM